MNDLKLKIDDILDVPGSTDYYNQWEYSCKRADIIFYMVRANEIFENNQATIKRVKKDLHRIDSWLENRNPKPMFFILGTFCDYHHEFKNITLATQGNYIDKFSKIPIIKELKSLSSNKKNSTIILGSMKDIEHTQRFVYNLLKQVLL